MWTSAQFEIEPQFEPDTGNLGDGRPEVRGDTATDGLDLLAEGSHGDQSTARGTRNRSRGDLSPQRHTH